MERQYLPHRRKKTDPQFVLARLLRVWDTEGNEVRMATILNIAFVIGIVFSLVVPGFFIAIYEQRLFSLTPPMLLAMGGSSLIWHGLSIVYNNRGHYRQAALAYVGFACMLFTAAILIAGGSRSSLWIFYAWPVIVAVVFLPLKAMLSFFFGLIVLWVLLFFGEQSGIYAPLLMTAADVQVRYVPLFMLTILSMCISLLGYAFSHLSSTQVELGQAAQALQHYRDSLEAQVQERTEAAGRFSQQLEVLQALNRIIVLAVDMDDLLRRAVRLMSEAFDAYQAMVFLIDESGERLIQQVSSLETGALEVVQLRVGQEGIVGYAAATGQSYVTNDVASDPYYKQFPDLVASVSAAAIPIIVQEQIIGVLALESTARDTFTGTTMEVLNAMANVLGVAILNARNLEQLRTLLGRLSQYEEQEFLEQWRRVFERRQGRIGLLYDRIQVRPLDVAEGARLFEAEASPAAQSVTVERPDGAHVLLVPLNVRERPLGRLMFESDKPWRQEERVLVESVTAQLGLALENARLLEATRRSAVLEQTAGELTSRFRQQVEIEAVLQQALADLAQALGAERGVVRLIPVAEREGQA